MIMIQVVIISRNNTYVGILTNDEYDMVIQKANLQFKRVEIKGNTLIVKSEVYNSTYMKEIIERIVNEV